MKINKALLAVFAGGVVLLVVVISALFGGRGVSQKPENGVITSAGEDSKKNTLLALEAKVSESLAENEILRDENSQMTARNRQLSDELSALRQKVTAVEERVTRASNSGTSVIDRLDEYEQKLSESAKAGKEKLANTGSRFFERLKAPSAGGVSESQGVVSESEGTTSSVFTFDRFKSQQNGGTVNLGVGMSWAAPANRGDYDPKKNTGTTKADKKSTGSKMVRKYTISPLAVGFDGVSVTGLVGRIPVKGKTVDPYRAKIMIGRDNLAANGYYFDHVDGMVVEGWAVGDWNLSCVSVKIDSYSFVFDDGTIVAKEPQGGSLDSGDSIGYISMRNGFPCVPGDFHTNAPAFLAQQGVLSGIKAAGEAYAAKQTSTENLPLGGSRSTVTGNTGQYAWGKAISSSVDGSIQWVVERQQNSFDAVVTPPGETVSVHFEKQIEIDYDPEGRRINHEESLAYQSLLD